MKEFSRTDPRFALCGLNCGLCPRHHTDGVSKCPGCGGPEFHLKHPTCAVITCNRKRDNVEFCFQCSSFPCEKYSKPSATDSFITYRNVLADFEKAKSLGVKKYIKDLNTKLGILEKLLEAFDDGRRKNHYCLAVNLLPLPLLERSMKTIEKKSAEEDLKEKCRRAVETIDSAAKEAGVELKLRM